MARTPSAEPPAVRIDPETGWAWRGDERLDLAPKAFAVLCRLIQRPEHLVTKDELLAAAWGDAVVGEATLTSCIRDLRKALDDSSRTPRYIETVHRRGFRFIGPVGAPRAPSRAHPPVAPPASTLVGRDADLARLDALLATAVGGQRRVVFVTGEAGIGKTTLVETFLGRIDRGDVHIARGQCVEQYGASEPYLPLLEALGRMGRDRRGDALIRVLRQYAPTWLVQLPALLGDEELQAVQRRAQGTTRERMLRELIEALDAFGTDAPLVLVLEDLHWSDAGTIDLLAMIARRRDPARLLVVATYRPADVAASAHPLGSVQQDLRVHGHCEELALDFLGEAAVGEYLARRFPGASFPPDVALVLHDNTSGNPLFLVNVVDDLVAQGHVRDDDGRWTLAIPVERVAAGVPHTLSQMIEKQIDRLAPDERAVLAVGSVAGAEFSAALSTADGIDARDGERSCEALARRGQFLRAAGPAEWPDGTVAGRYAFIHAMYRSVLYERIPIGHRVGLHLRVGARLERAHGARAGEIAGELAMHFEHGRDFARAVQYRRQAAETALRQHGYREAVDHARHGLERLAALPESPERNRQEIDVQTLLGVAVVATNGWADPDVARAFARARDLCAATGVTPQLFPVLLGLCGFDLMRGEVRVAREAAAQLLGVAETIGHAAALLGAHNSAGMCAFYSGELVGALAHFDRASAIYDPEQHSPSRLRGFSVDHDPGVSCASHTGLTLMLLGHQDRAAKRMTEALAYARAIDHPLSLAMAYNFAATFYYFRREPEIVEELEEVRGHYARKYDFDLFLMLGEFSRGWLLAEQGRLEEGAERIQQGLAVYQAIGAELGRPTFLGILADVLGRLGRTDEALAVVADAIELAGRTGLRYWDAELHRLKGSLLVQGGADSDAESCFHEALAIARRQEAKALELRAAMSLARLWRDRRRVADARALLTDVYAWFTEGFGTPDLVDAKALLAEMEPGAKRRR